MRHPFFAAFFFPFFLSFFSFLFLFPFWNGGTTAVNSGWLAPGAFAAVPGAWLAFGLCLWGLAIVGLNRSLRRVLRDGGGSDCGGPRNHGGRLLGLLYR